METFAFKNKKYNVDSLGFLMNPGQWDEDFAEGMAEKNGFKVGLNEKQWNVIRYIRDFFVNYGKCPVVYKTCKDNKLRLRDLKELFPSGYQRGACKLAGISYIEGYLNYKWYEPVTDKIKPEIKPERKIYCIDVRGFLEDPSQWDENFAIHRAEDMKLPDGLTEKHWKIINYLRDQFAKKGFIPTIYETCEANCLELDAFEELFPNGYHRGAVKMAGLHVR